MAGETIKTEGIVLQIRPWSRTSHVVTWLTPDHGIISTIVKGAVRSRSVFLGQYDLFYTCEIIYYASPQGELHPLREVTPLERRDHLRHQWREICLAGYAAELVRKVAPSYCISQEWFVLLSRTLDELAQEHSTRPLLKQLISLEMGVLNHAGLSPDFSGLDANTPWTLFSIDKGCCGESLRNFRLTPQIVTALRGAPHGDEKGALHFLGMFITYHLELSADSRRALITLLESSPRA